MPNSCNKTLSKYIENDDNFSKLMNECKGVFKKKKINECLYNNSNN